MIPYIFILVIVFVLSIYGYKRFVAWNTPRQDKINLNQVWPNSFEEKKEGEKSKFIRIFDKNGDQHYGRFQKIDCLRVTNTHLSRYGVYFARPSGVPGGGWDDFIAGSNIQKIEETDPPQKPYWS